MFYAYTVFRCDNEFDDEIMKCSYLFKCLQKELIRKDEPDRSLEDIEFITNFSRLRES